MDLKVSSFLLILTSPAAAVNDTAVHTDLQGTLLSNRTTTSSGSACSANWLGINFTNNRVIVVSRASLRLYSPIDALSSLDQPHLLDPRSNSLNGTLAALSQCPNLKLIYLSTNEFFGEIPLELSFLRRLDLFNNNLYGPSPCNSPTSCAASPSTSITTSSPSTATTIIRVRE